MKRSIINFLPIVFLLLISCDDSILKPEIENTEGLNIQIGNSILFTEDDIEYYDHSAHYFYFKKPINDWITNFDYSKFWITNNLNVIYEGIFITTFSCSCVSDSFLVYEYPYLPGFVLHFGNLVDYEKTNSIYQEYRENKVFLDNLKELGLYYNGLECTLHSLEITGKNELTASYTISNNDPWNYYFLDPEKVPIDYYYNHYRYIKLRNTEAINYFWTEPYYDGMWHRSEEWDISWLTLIESGGSKTYTTKYKVFEKMDPLKPGLYRIHMKIPGLTYMFTSPEERLLENGRIWLGEIELVQLMEVE
ncbi:MAG: hypothetical protein JW798_08050 [Prolixibacteraceae bacterium]|nr:hypothetical protein [Prolixibacteraceae bacterium]